MDVSSSSTQVMQPVLLQQHLRAVALVTCISQAVASIPWLAAIATASLDPTPASHITAAASNSGNPTAKADAQVARIEESLAIFSRVSGFFLLVLVPYFLIGLSSSDGNWPWNAVRHKRRHHSQHKARIHRRTDKMSIVSCWNSCS